MTRPTWIAALGVEDVEKSARKEGLLTVTRGGDAAGFSSPWQLKQV